MNPQSRGPEQALTILAISTAVMGFGLFGGDLFPDGILIDSLPNSISSLKFVCAGMVFSYYVWGFRLTKDIVLRGNDVTGKDVVDGPLTQLFWQVLYVALIFVLGVIEETLRN